MNSPVNALNITPEQFRNSKLYCTLRNEYLNEFPLDNIGCLDAPDDILSGSCYGGEFALLARSAWR